jgi:FAD/FMN-containing dehydrogenase
VGGGEQIIAELAGKLTGTVVLPSQPEYKMATKIWSRTSSRPRAVVRCKDTGDVREAVIAAVKAGLPLSVKGGGHDWAGRALCDGVVVDLTGMRDVTIASDGSRARVGGGALASDVASRTDELGLAAVTGSIGVVGLCGLTLGGGYGPLNGRFGLASDNLIEAEVVLASGQVVIAGAEGDPDLLWALQGGGGNFGVVTRMSIRLHRVPSVYTGLIMYHLSEATAVLDRVQEFCRTAPEALSVQLALVSSPDGEPVAAVVPTWSGDAESGEKEVASLLSLAEPIHSDVKRRSIGEALAMFDGPITDTHGVVMENRWLSEVSREAAEVLVHQTIKRPGPGCSLITHEFRGEAARVPADATAFGMRSEHVLVEIVAQYDEGDGSAERAWTEETCRLLEPFSLPGGYPNLLGRDDPRAALSYGPNSARLAELKRRYDPHNLFRSATALPRLASARP